jgi:hypothetical protein
MTIRRYDPHNAEWIEEEEEPEGGVSDWSYGDPDPGGSDSN